MSQPAIIFFDGICNLCCGWVQFLIKMDKKNTFKFASIQSESGKKLLKSIEFSVKIPETIVYMKGNIVYTESTAVLKILQELGGVWKAFTIFRLIPKAIRDSIYRFIARKRYSIFGKRETCLLPTPENQEKFLF